MAESTTTPNYSSAIASDTKSPANLSISPLTSIPPDHHRATMSNRPVHKARPSSSSVSSVQKTKKRVPWRGKICVISLPSSYSSRDFGEHAKDHPSLVLPDSEVQTRPSFPHPEDIFAERVERSFQIRIPTKTSWEYVKELQEAKLRALGVGPGHGKSRASPPSGTFPLKWHTSSQSRSLPVSPSMLSPYASRPLAQIAYGPQHRSPDAHHLELPSSSASRMNSNPVKERSVKHFPRFSMSNFRQSPEVPFSNNFDSPNFVPSPNESGIYPNLNRGVLPLYRSTSARSPDNRALPRYLGDRPSDFNEQPPATQSQRQPEHQESSTQSLDHCVPDTSNSEPVFQYPIPRSYRNGVPEELERRLHEAEGNHDDISSQRSGNDSIGQIGAMIQLDPAQPSKTPSIPEDVDDYNERLDAEEPLKETSRTASGLNALAPEFKVENSTRLPTLPTGGTMMRPTAPVFTPSSTTQQLPTSHEFTFLYNGPKFRAVPNVARPAKSSKALEIRTPKDQWSTGVLDGEVQEDESGRITQADGRQKRQRRTSEEGLQDAHVGPRGHSASSVVKPRSRPSDLDPLIAKQQHGRHSSESLEKATQAANQLKQIIDDFSSSEDASSLAQSAESADPEGPATNFHEVPEAVAFDAAQKGSAEPQRTAEDLPTTCGSFPKHATSPISGSPSKDNDGSKRHEDFHGRRSSPTQHDSKPFDVETSGTLSEEGSALQTAYVENEKSGCNSPQPMGGVVDGLSSVDPCRELVGADMKHATDEDSGQRIKDENMHAPYHVPNQISTHDFQVPKTDLRVDTKSSVHNPDLDDGLSQGFQYLPPGESESVNSSVVRLVAENARFSPSYRPSYGSDRPFPADGLGSAESAAISEWDKGLSSSEEAKSDREQAILEACVHGVVDKVLEDQLMPLKESLASIRSSVLELAKQTSSSVAQPKSHGREDSSDADDEEDADHTESTTRSPTRDRKTEKLKAMMREVLATQPKTGPTNELETIVETMKELKNVVQGTGPPSTDVKAAVEEAIGRQMRGRSGPITSSHQSATAEKSQLHIAGLESMLKIAEGRAEDEMKARRATEDALADSQRLLRHALQDAAEQRESAEETEQSLSAFHEERHELLRRNALLEGAQDSSERTASELTEKNTALEGTLEEYRLSSAQWREEIESAKVENNDLRRTVNALRTEMEENIDGRQVLQVKFDQLQDRMAAVSQSIAHDQSSWQIKEGEYKAKCDVLIADGGRLSQSCEDMSAKITTLSEKLQLSEHERHDATVELQRQLDDRIERANLERDRLQSKIDNESREMASKLDHVQVTSEKIITSIKSQLDRVTEAANADRILFEQHLQKVSASGAAAIENNQAFHDKVVGSLKGQNEQMELQCRERLQLAEEKLSLHQDKVELLEEKLDVAKSAAQAAVQAVRSNRSASKGSHSGHSFVSGSMSSPPARTSPQALRESILVLQEQLQDREMQLEELQQRLAAVDTEAPAKVKAQETEIIWLRELLGVRVDDLEDLIAALSWPEHDREAIKDAAIRLKANIEMEQQEKERVHHGSQSFPSLATISNLTSSPRSLPLAAAAAWGNWRKGRMGPVPSVFGRANGHIAETPSRVSPSTQSIMSGLMTPPHTEVRGEDGSGGRSGGGNAPSRTRPTTSSTPRQDNTLPRPDGVLQRSQRPVTPSLTRRSNYDMDAESTDLVQFHNTVEVSHGEAEEPFGPRIAAFSSHV
ncbi:MAG: hypothetical protein Q9169_003211 [Polycauliona sp. 2 TL-2023]